jgi:hypothetical protein
VAMYKKLNIPPRSGVRTMGIPLSTTNGSLVTSRSLTYVIYWHPKNLPIANGHASVIIDSAEFAKDMSSTMWYVSWAGRGDMGLKGAPGKSICIREDMGDWGGTPVGKDITLNNPTRWVALKGLNTAAMRQEWDKIRRKHNAHWRLLDKNCATVAARVLKAGGGDANATKAKTQLVWWPSDVYRYAKSMAGMIDSTS